MKIFIVKQSAPSFPASKFGDFKMKIYWSSLNLAVSQINVLNSYSDRLVLIGATIKGKNMPP